MLTIRPAVEADIPIILDLIRGLAAYERAPDAVHATEDDLRRHGFGPEPKYKCLIAEWHGAPAGFALWFYNFSTWEGRPGIYLEDLFVKPEFRGKGIGKALLLHLARVAHGEGCGRYEWQVLDWNTPAIEFYERLGARVMKEWLPMRVDGEALAKMAEMAKR